MKRSEGGSRAGPPPRSGTVRAYRSSDEDAVIDFYRRRGYVEHDRQVDEGTGLPVWIMRLA